MRLLGLLTLQQVQQLLSLIKGDVSLVLIDMLSITCGLGCCRKLQVVVHGAHSLALQPVVPHVGALEARIDHHVHGVGGADAQVRAQRVRHGIGLLLARVAYRKGRAALILFLICRSLRYEVSDRLLGGAKYSRRLIQEA